MNRQPLLLLLNFIASIGCLVGLIVWTTDTDIFSITGGYQYLWFLTILTLMVGLVGAAYHYFLQPQTLRVGIDHMITMSGLLSVLWLAGVCVITTYVAECSELQKKSAGSSLSCNGEIVTTTFSYFSLLVWMYILGCTIYRPETPIISLQLQTAETSNV